MNKDTGPGPRGSVGKRQKPDPLLVLDIPLVFTQRPVLTRAKFGEEARERGVLLSEPALDLLDRHGILSPFFRARRSMKGVRSAIQSTASGTWPRYPGWTFDDDVAGLRLDRDAGYLRTGRGSTAVPSAPLSRLIGGVHVRVHESLYSPYQLLDIADAAALAPDLQSVRRSAHSRVRIEAARRRSSESIDRAVLLTVLEPYFYPRVTGNLRIPVHIGMHAWYAEDSTFDARATLDWSGWTPEEIRKNAEGLLFDAWVIDPLRDWVDLVRHVGPWRWRTLRGAARQAIELRVAGEMLIRFHEALHRAKVAPALEESRSRSRGALDDRLRPDPSNLDAVLARYGLSPHPAVLLVAEGETEMALVPLVMDELGIRRDDAYIKVINARTENRDHSLLVRYAALPRLGPVEGDSTDFLRPPTRYLIAVDGDRKFRTQAARDAERDKRVDELMGDLDAVYRTPAARNDVRSMILVESWADGLDFERANFNDTELARALLASGCAPTTIPMHQLEAVLVGQRQDALAGHSRNIAAVWRDWPCEPSKPAVALHLWPVLRARIRSKRSRAGLDSIPVVRVLLLARDLADGPRANLLLRV